MATNFPTIKWGVVGAGRISEWFVSDILLPSWPEQIAHHRVVAVGSSSKSKSQKFVDQWYADPDVQFVYVGTVHCLHLENCLGAIKAGKHVLCEKPFTMNSREAETVINAAKEKGVFLMEGKSCQLLLESHEC